MNILFIGKRGRQTKTLKLGSPVVLLGALFALTAVPAVMFYGGYFSGQQSQPAQDQALLASWQGEMSAQREEIAAARRKVDEDMDALALRLGELQAKMIRLDALVGRSEGKLSPTQPGTNGNRFFVIRIIC